MPKKEASPSSSVTAPSDFDAGSNAPVLDLTGDDDGEGSDQAASPTPSNEVVPQDDDEDGKSDGQDSVKSGREERAEDSVTEEEFVDIATRRSASTTPPVIEDESATGSTDQVEEASHQTEVAAETLTPPTEQERTSRADCLPQKTKPPLTRPRNVLPVKSKRQPEKEEPEKKLRSLGYNSALHGKPLSSIVKNTQPARIPSLQSTRSISELLQAKPSPSNRRFGLNKNTQVPRMHTDIRTVEPRTARKVVVELKGLRSDGDEDENDGDQTQEDASYQAWTKRRDNETEVQYLMRIFNESGGDNEYSEKIPAANGDNEVASERAEEEQYVE